MAKTPAFLREAIAFMAWQDGFNYRFISRAHVLIDPTLGTMGVAIKNNEIFFMYDPAFVASLTTNELTFVLRHEVMHLVLHHCTSRQVSDPRRHALANIAMDLAINSLIPIDENCELPTAKEEYVGTDYEGKPMLVKVGDRLGMFPDTFGFPKALSYEQYMILLEEKYPAKEWNKDEEQKSQKCPYCQRKEREEKERQEKEKQEEQEKQDKGEAANGEGNEPGDEPGEGSDGNEPGDEPGEGSDGDGSGEGGSGEGDSGEGGGSGEGGSGEGGPGEGEEQDHCTCRGQGSGQGQGQGQENRNLPQIPTLDQHREFSESPLVEAEIRDQVKKAQSSKSWGSVPGNAQAAIRLAQRTEITWRKHIHKKFGRFPSPEREYTSRKPDRKRGYPYPGKTMNSFTNAVYVFMDSSASVDDGDLSVFLAETSVLARHMPLYLQFFDTQLAGKPLLIKGKIKNEVMVKGRGGTCFQGPIDLAIEKKTKQIVIFSDGFAPEPEYKDYRGKILWVITKDGSKEIQSWRGDKIYLTSTFSEV